MTFFSLRNVSYINDDKIILSEINIDINPGDFISIIGPSGSGKSTLLKLCCHLISPTSGSIMYKDKSLISYNPVDLRKEISYCFQTPYLFGENVMDNLSFPYSIRKERPDVNRIYDLLSQFNLDRDFIHKPVKNLSGGEKQRISLIRNLLFTPQILLLDEVTAALDAENTGLVEDVISSVNSSNTTILWVTHNLEQSRKYANKVLTIENGKLKSQEVLR